MEHVKGEVRPKKDPIVEELTYSKQNGWELKTSKKLYKTCANCKKELELPAYYCQLLGHFYCETCEKGEDPFFGCAFLEDEHIHTKVNHVEKIEVKKEENNGIQ